MLKGYLQIFQTYMLTKFHYSPTGNGLAGQIAVYTTNFKSFWFLKKNCAKFIQNTAKFAFCDSVICITKFNKSTSYLHTPQGQPDRLTYLTTVGLQ